MIEFVSEPRADGRRRLHCTECGLVTAYTLSDPNQLIHRCTDSAIAKNLAADLGKDEALIGNRLAEIFQWCGVPPCGGCEKRKEWLNSVHHWLKTKGL